MLNFFGEKIFTSRFLGQLKELVSKWHSSLTSISSHMVKLKKQLILKAYQENFYDELLWQDRFKHKTPLDEAAFLD